MVVFNLKGKQTASLRMRNASIIMMGIKWHRLFAFLRKWRACYSFICRHRLSRRDMSLLIQINYMYRL